MIQVQFMGELKNFHPEDVSSMILTKMKETTEVHLRNKINDGVVMVSARFSDSQRQATMNTGSTSCLNVLRVINEPNTAVNHIDMSNVLIGDVVGDFLSLVPELSSSTVTSH